MVDLYLHSLCMPSWPGQGQLSLLRGGGACFMARDAVVVTLTVYQLDTMGPTDRPTDRPTGRPAVLPAHTVWLRAVFGKNKDRRCSSFDPSERN